MERKIIDFHTHAFPEKIAGKTIAFLSEKGGIPAYTDGTTETIENFDGYYEFDNGMWIDAYYNDIGEENCEFIIEANGVVLVCEECTLRDATLKENIRYFKEINREYIKEYFSSIFSFGNDSDSADTRKVIISNMILNVAQFAEFYLAGPSVG